LIWRQAVPDPAAAPVSVKAEKAPEAGVVPPIAGGEARNVARSIDVGAIAEPDGCHPRKNVCPEVVGLARKAVVFAALWYRTEPVAPPVIPPESPVVVFARVALDASTSWLLEFVPTIVFEAGIASPLTFATPGLG